MKCFFEKLKQPRCVDWGKCIEWNARIVFTDWIRDYSQTEQSYAVFAILSKAIGKHEKQGNDRACTRSKYDFRIILPYFNSGSNRSPAPESYSTLRQTTSIRDKQWRIAGRFCINRRIRRLLAFAFAIDSDHFGRIKRAFHLNKCESVETLH